MPDNPMDHRNDPIWQMGQQGQQANAQRAQQIAQGWANKEQYYQRQAIDAALRVPFKFGRWLWEFVRCVFCVYVGGWIGFGLARTCFTGAIWLQGDNSFFNLGLALGLIDVFLFLLSVVFTAAALASFAWGFWTMTWVGKIIALFFVYNALLWWIHHWEMDGALRFFGAFFFCIVLSTIIEGANIWYQSRKAGPAV